MVTNLPLPPPQSGQTPPSEGSPGQTPTTTTTSGQTPQQQQPPRQTPQSGRTSLDDLPQDIQDLVRGLRREAKETREALDTKLRAEQELESARLKEQGQWKALAEQHESRVKELEPAVTLLQELSELIAEQIKVDTKDWPASVKALDPGKDAPIKARLAWKTQAAAIVTELSTQARGQLPGNRPNPPAAGQPSREDVVARNMQEMKKTRAYGI